MPPFPFLDRPVTIDKQLLCQSAQSNLKLLKMAE